MRATRLGRPRRSLRGTWVEPDAPDRRRDRPEHLTQRALEVGHVMGPELGGRKTAGDLAQVVLGRLIVSEDDEVAAADPIHCTPLNSSDLMCPRRSSQ